MLTENIEIRVDEKVPCGLSCLVDTTYLTGESAEAVGEHSTRFICYVCCEKQKIKIEKHMSELSGICEQMKTL